MRKFSHFTFAVLFVVMMNHLQASPINEIKQDLSDSVITTKITAKFAKNKIVNPLKISVSTHKGVVKLKGYVKNKKLFVEALRLAKSTKGVRAVNTNNLEIKRVNTSLTDAYITAKVEAAVLKAKVLDDESIPIVGINASTKNGIVTLSGKVKQNQSIPFILKRARAVHGVKRVIMRLTIQKEVT